MNDYTIYQQDKLLQALTGETDERKQQDVLDRLRQEAKARKDQYRFD